MWREALRDRVLAPPDAGFSKRLAAFASAAAACAEACGAAAEDGLEWPGARGGAQPPYELPPGTGRRGPDKLWARFDEAVAEPDRVSEGRSMRAVGRAYADLADVASELANAVEREGSGNPATAGSGTPATQIGTTPPPGSRSDLSRTSSADPEAAGEARARALGERALSAGGFEIRKSPGAVERRGVGPVDAEVDEPAFAGDCLDPSAVGVGGLLGTEIEIGLRCVSEDLRGEFDQGEPPGADR